MMRGKRSDGRVAQETALKSGSAEQKSRRTIDGAQTGAFIKASKPNVRLKAMSHVVNLA